MGMKIYLDGEFVDKEDAKISVFDHGVLYGDGVFEGIRAYAGKVFRLEEHIKRLYESAHSLLLEIPMTQEEMIDVVHKSLEINNLTDAYIRLVVTRGVGDLGLDPRKCPKATVFCIAASIALYPKELYDTGLNVIIVSTPKQSPMALSPKVKSLNYLGNILAKIEGMSAGCMEVIMLNCEGYVAECSADNIFVVKDGAITTPPASAGILEGVTRGAVMDLAGELGIVLKEENLTRHDLYVADEIFITGTAAEVIAVVNIDRRVIGEGKPGAITGKMLEAYRKLTGQE